MTGQPSFILTSLGQKIVTFTIDEWEIKWRMLQLRQLPLAHSATTQKPSSMRLMTTSDQITAKSTYYRLKDADDPEWTSASAKASSSPMPLFDGLKPPNKAEPETRKAPAKRDGPAQS